MVCPCSLLRMVGYPNRGGQVVMMGDRADILLPLLHESQTILQHSPRHPVVRIA